MKNPYGYDRTAPPLRSQATQRLMCRAWEEGQAATKAEQAEIVSELVEALRYLCNYSLTEYDYLDRGIGTATPHGKRMLAARAVIAKAKRE